ncbi:MAG: flavodoxin family protein [Saprospiraceae bacterium]
MSNILIIQGSSRSDGDTRLVINYLLEDNNYDVIDLLDYDIGYFDYEFKNKEDDFLPLMRSILSKYDTFILATPIYWYSMSAQMKTFFDRLSDLLKIEKDLGRTLRGKSMAMISCSGSDDRNENFSEPFVLSADYLAMKYLGDVHAFVEGGKLGDGVEGRLDGFERVLDV